MGMEIFRTAHRAERNALFPCGSAKRITAPKAHTTRSGGFLKRTRRRIVNLHAVPYCRGVRFRLIFRLAPLLIASLLSSCATKDRDHTVRISVPDQKMAVYEHGTEIARYDVSTSKFGLGDRPGSCATPLGKMEIAKKIGGHAPVGMKFKNRRPTGEIVQIDAPGRDPIVTRILWLKGLERGNRNAFGRTIYIHGTAEERRIGSPASYGCIRMRSRDVVSLYNIVGVGAEVDVTESNLPLVAETAPVPNAMPTTAATANR